MQNPPIIPALILLAAMLLFIPACQREQISNIIIIFTDDQGYADLGCYGAKGYQTPNIDQLAQEGVLFTSFYVSEAVCSASRSSLLTGCYAQRVSIRGALSPFSMTGLNPDEATIASLLKKRGYHTGIIGKWHLGSIREFYPDQYGFDEYFGLPYSNDMWPVGYDGQTLEEGYKSIYPPLPLIKDSSPVDTIKSLHDQDQLTTKYTEEALSFIERNAENPFFLYLAHSMVHVPLGVSPEYRGTSRQGKFGDVVQEIDGSVGQIMHKLKELGIEDRTLVVFTSDNGPWLNFGNHAGSAFPLREGKGTAWEGGVRVPCIFWYPSRFEEGIVTEKMASTIDLLPTIAALTGVPLPDQEIDGVDMLPVLKGDENANPRIEFFYYYEGVLCAVRRGAWKLVLPHSYRSYEGVEPGSDGMPGPYSRRTAGLELYNLDADVGESIDVSGENPQIVEELSALADSVREVLGDEHLGIRGKKNRSPGRVRADDSLYRHLGFQQPYVLKNQPDRRYPGGSEFALTDGYRGSMEFTDKSWCGFHGMDVDMVIDLGNQQEINMIEMNFLRNQASWIFLPETISISISDDGKEFQPLDLQNFSSRKKDLEIDIWPFRSYKKVSTKFLRLQIASVGTCPDWHPGKGQPAWLFLDEVIIQ